jgi:hypothetical protein
MSWERMKRLGIDWLAVVRPNVRSWSPSAGARWIADEALASGMNTTDVIRETSIDAIGILQG